MPPLVAAYLAAAVAFCLADLLWLGFVAKAFIQAQIGPLVRTPPDWTAAAIFYAMYLGGVVFFAVRPALADGSLGTAALHGALFGFFCYATYDLTNLATLRGWTLPMALVDIGWGTVVTALAATAGFLGARAAT
jgi:uncharacterized membrane protein